MYLMKNKATRELWGSIQLHFPHYCTTLVSTILLCDCVVSLALTGCCCCCLRVSYVRDAAPPPFSLSPPFVRWTGSFSASTATHWGTLCFFFWTRGQPSFEVFHRSDDAVCLWILIPETRGLSASSILLTGAGCRSKFRRDARPAPFSLLANVSRCGHLAFRRRLTVSRVNEVFFI